MRRVMRLPSHRRHYREKQTDLNLTPMMNLITILIPVLLVSIAFIEIVTVEAAVPGQSPSETTGGEELEVRLRITETGYALTDIERDHPEARTLLVSADAGVPFEAASTP